MAAKGKYEEKSVEILAYLSQGYTNKDACEKASISEVTFYEWVNTKPNFSKSVQEARKLGDKVRVADVERALLDIAKGFEYEEVRTEYESKLDETGQYVPTIKKQVRTKKRVIPSTEAIKFYLTNKAPDEWKNRLEQNTTGSLVTDLRIEHVAKNPDDVQFPSSEDEVDAER